MDRHRAAEALKGVLATIAFVVGVVFGIGIASYGSRGGLSGVLGAGILTAAVIGLMGLLAIVAIVGAWWQRGRRRTVTPAALAGAAVLAFGAVTGSIVAPVLGLTVAPPVVLRSAGTVTVIVDDARFAPADTHTATCSSAPDEPNVDVIDGLDLGELNGGTMRASLFASADGPSLSIWIDGADRPEGSPFVEWHGLISTADLASDGSTGEGSFIAELGLMDAKDPNAPTDPPGTWPEALEGSIAWQCEGWGVAG